ncbi:MAG: hypothetical protein FWC93_08500 [Defluviitaleaceae bacterium]|nr:hypothetical protein [Defluviitaleaceae bacterium]
MRKKFDTPVKEPLRSLFAAVFSLTPMLSIGANIEHNRMTISFLVVTCCFCLWGVINFFTFRAEIADGEIRHRNRLGKYRVYPFGAVTEIKKKARRTLGRKKLYIITIYVDGEKAFVVDSAMHGYDDFAKCAQRDLRHIFTNYGGQDEAIKDR